MTQQNEFYYDGVSFTAKDYMNTVIAIKSKDILDKFFYLMRASAQAGDTSASSFFVCQADVPMPIKKVVKEHLSRCGYKFIGNPLKDGIMVENPIQNGT